MGDVYMLEKEDEFDYMQNSNAFSLKEKVILCLRLGFIDGKKHTLLEISELIRCTREFVRQTEARLTLGEITKTRG